MEVRTGRTCDNDFSAAPVGAALVAAGADVDAAVARLDAGEVQLCSCTVGRGERGVSLKRAVPVYNVRINDRPSTVCPAPCLRRSALPDMGRPSSLDQ